MDGGRTAGLPGHPLGVMHDPNSFAEPAITWKFLTWGAVMTSAATSRHSSRPREEYVTGRGGGLVIFASVVPAVLGFFHLAAAGGRLRLAEQPGYLAAGVEDGVHSRGLSDALCT
jgi:UDP-N-acetylmuramyl pentapeptide phosphotransferase/UDP-N-acetylglucosamine-1-phosphate transferase